MDDTLYERLVAVARTIEHVGDCGWLLWNPDTRQAFWVAADSDPEDEEDAREQLEYCPEEPPGTPMTEVERRFLAVDGVASFACDKEAYPDEPPWLWLNYRRSPPLVMPASEARL
jgi:hypothetical protein